MRASGGAQLVGVVLAAAGSLMATIGAVAVGVTVGLTRADWTRQH